jgi:hypothetical protein
MYMERSANAAVAWIAVTRFALCASEARFAWSAQELAGLNVIGEHVENNLLAAPGDLRAVMPALSGPLAGKDGNHEPGKDGQS